MAKQYCPTCGQELQAGKTTHELHEKLNKEKFAAEQAGKRAARQEFETQRKEIEAAAKRNAEAEANKRLEQRVDQQVKTTLAEERRAYRQEAAAALAKKDQENAALKQQVKMPRKISRPKSLTLWRRL